MEEEVLVVMISREQFDYLKPALPDKIQTRALKGCNEYYFVGTSEGLEDIKLRLKGLDY